MRHVLENYPQMRLVPAEPFVGAGAGLVGKHPNGLLRQDGGQEEEKWLSEEEARKVQRFDPCGSQDTNGFFIAAFVKQEE